MKSVFGHEGETDGNYAQKMSWSRLCIISLQDIHEELSFGRQHFPYERLEKRNPEELYSSASKKLQQRFPNFIINELDVYTQSIIQIRMGLRFLDKRLSFSARRAIFTFVFNYLKLLIKK